MHTSLFFVHSFSCESAHSFMHLVPGLVWRRRWSSVNMKRSPESPLSHLEIYFHYKLKVLSNVSIHFRALVIIITSMNSQVDEIPVCRYMFLHLTIMATVWITYIRTHAQHLKQKHKHHFVACSDTSVSLSQGFSLPTGFTRCLTVRPGDPSPSSMRPHAPLGHLVSVMIH